MCDEWRRIDELAGLVISRLEFERGERRSTQPTRSTAAERVATDSRREGHLSVARALVGGDTGAICETERTGSAKPPAKLVWAQSAGEVRAPQGVLPAKRSYADRSIITVQARRPARRVPRSAVVIDLAVYRETRGHSALANSP